MTQNEAWSAYAGSDALWLAAVLFVIACALAYWGTRLRRPVGVDRPGKAVGILLVMIWCLSLATLSIADGIYLRTLVQQYRALHPEVTASTPPTNPITPVTFLSAMVAFFTIIYLTRRHGLKIALGSAIVGTVAAPMIFELPFDLIVMGRTHPPAPAVQYTLLYFLPLFLWEFSSFALLTLSPIARLSKYTLFALAAMFFVFAVWALFGFAYPSAPLPTALNMVSKVLCFVAAVTLFWPARGVSGQTESVSETDSVSASRSGNPNGEGA